MNNDEEEDLRDQFYDHIIRQRTMPRRTNWRHHAYAVSQVEVAITAYIQSSTNDYCLLIFCFHELDLSIQRNDELLNIHEDQVIPLFNSPPRNRLIDEVTEEDAYAWTGFCKHQLRLLMVHLHILNTVVVGPRQRYRFSGEELLIVCLTRIATGDPWTRLTPSHFGGDVRCWSIAFCWFIHHMYITFYHKISG
jgi:hypothetical protein